MRTFSPLRTGNNRIGKPDTRAAYFSPRERGTTQDSLAYRNANIFSPLRTGEQPF